MNDTLTTNGATRSQLLQRALQGNALFSAASGLGFLLAPGWLARTTGIQSPLAFTVVGVFAILQLLGLRRLESE